MKQLELASTGCTTTQLGYGCSEIMGAVSRKNSLALLQAAFDAGIRHFDVAPVYGYGAAESCLGQFLLRHRHEVTITTKFGLPRAQNRRLMEAARGVVAPLMAAIPSLKKRMARIADSVAKTGTKQAYTAEMAMASLHESLLQLRCEQVDLFLMHEATAEDLSDERLLEALHRAKASGKIGGFGVGSDAAKISDLVNQRPEYCGVLQFDWSVLKAQTITTKSFRIHHRALGDAFRLLSRLLSDSPSLSRDWSRKIGADLSAPGMLGKIMMSAALDQNADGLLLFSSRNKDHIRTNVETAETKSLTAIATSFCTLLHHETNREAVNGRTTLVNVEGSV